MYNSYDLDVGYSFKLEVYFDEIEESLSCVHEKISKYFSSILMGCYRESFPNSFYRFRTKKSHVFLHSLENQLI